MEIMTLMACHLGVSFFVVFGYTILTLGFKETFRVIALMLYYEMIFQGIQVNTIILRVCSNVLLGYSG